MTTMLSSDLPLPKIGRGKVRDIYAVDEDRLLLVTTDRISAFDVVMGETIPMKGAVLTQISAFWFNELEGVVPHHMISADTDEIVAAVPALKPHRTEILGRAMLCKRTTVFPIECVIRGYLSGSAWKEYAASGTLAGEKLKAGLVESEKLEPAIFSPATKAESGHDENITIAKMRAVVGDEVAYTLESMTRAIYTLGEELAREQGIIIADTKFEFGRDKDGRIILIDEVMTPDSSRFWAVDAYRPGQPQASFDKQQAAGSAPIFLAGGVSSGSSFFSASSRCCDFETAILLPITSFELSGISMRMSSSGKVVQARTTLSPMSFFLSFVADSVLYFPSTTLTLHLPHTPLPPHEATRYIPLSRRL